MTSANEEPSMKMTEPKAAPPIAAIAAGIATFAVTLTSIIVSLGWRIGVIGIIGTAALAVGLSQLGRPPSRTRRGLLITAGSGLLVAAVVVPLAVFVIFGGKTSPLDYLPDAPGSVTYQTRFAKASDSTPWPTVQNVDFSGRYNDSGYSLRIRRLGASASVQNPLLRPTARQIILVRARLDRGQGGWGAWCRESSSGERYDFVVTHGGAARISWPGGGTDFVSLEDFDIYQYNVIKIECQDAPAVGLRLALSVDGRQIFRLSPPSPQLAPGNTGISAFTFSDVRGDLAAAQFSAFETRQPA